MLSMYVDVTSATKMTPGVTSLECLEGLPLLKRKRLGLQCKNHTCRGLDSPCCLVVEMVINRIGEVYIHIYIFIYIIRIPH